MFKNPNIRTIHLRHYGDERGMLTTIEENSDIPFTIKRVYYLSNLSKDKKRACHAHKLSQRVLIALNGSCNVSFFDGKEKYAYQLKSTTYEGAYFNSGIWCELSDFEDNTIILALSDMEYDEKEYIRNFDDYIRFKEGANQWK